MQQNIFFVYSTQLSRFFNYVQNFRRLGFFPKGSRKKFVGILNIQAADSTPVAVADVAVVVAVATVVVTSNRVANAEVANY